VGRRWHHLEFETIDGIKVFFFHKHKPHVQVLLFCMLLVNASKELAHSSLFLQINKSSKYNMCVFCAKDFAYMKICITLKPISSKQHPTPNPKKTKSKKKQTFHPKIFNNIIRRFFFLKF
jgi:hypothetical protein